MKRTLLLINVTFISTAFGLSPSITNFNTLPNSIKDMTKSTVMFNTETTHCTGVAIASNKILTAAHCFDPKTDGSIIKATKFDLKSNPVSSTIYKNLQGITYSRDHYDRKKLGDDYVILTIPGLNKSNYIKDTNRIKYNNITNYAYYNATTDTYILKSAYDVYFLGSQPHLGSSCKDIGEYGCMFEYQLASDGTANIFAEGNPKFYSFDVENAWKFEGGDSGAPVFIYHKDTGKCMLWGISESIYLSDPSTGIGVPLLDMMGV